ncbi:hypothetical protein [Brevibacillus fortis]|uniref:Uncharacterized protein n=1 Tax=Brevibacillus fortis TaxID=2126352 RepID=A0A2P7V3F6_9BACL|nr:hypothetical protein [Brevibacillus fortis]PSJ93741.1 hypothetical protein C7R93_17285 [Brevibacillus fortis]
MAQLPNTASIKDMVTALQTMECINQKADLAAVVGSPVVSTDDVATIITKLQNAKSTLAANLTAKGQAASGSEGVQSLADKVGAYNGKRWAGGTFTINGSGTVTVNGLGFKPNYVMVYQNNTRSSFDINVYIGNAKDTDVFFKNTLGPAFGGHVSGSTQNLTNNFLQMYDDYFSVFAITNLSATSFRWLAFE